MVSFSPPRLFRYLTIDQNNIQSSRFDSWEALKTRNPLTLFSISRTNHFNTVHSNCSHLSACCYCKGFYQVYEINHTEYYTSTTCSRNGYVIWSNIIAFNAVWLQSAQLNWYQALWLNSEHTELYLLSKLSIRRDFMQVLV